MTVVLDSMGSPSYHQTHKSSESIISASFHQLPNCNPVWEMSRQSSHQSKKHALSHGSFTR